MRPGRCGEQRGAVRRRPRHAVGADRAVGAGAVLDHHGLAERPRDPGADLPGHQIERRAGRERHHNGDRARRPGLCDGQRVAEQSGECPKNDRKHDRKRPHEHHPHIEGPARAGHGLSALTRRPSSGTLSRTRPRVGQDKPGHDERRDWPATAYSTFIPARLTTSAHLAISAFMNGSMSFSGMVDGSPAAAVMRC